MKARSLAGVGMVWMGLLAAPLCGQGNSAVVGMVRIEATGRNPEDGVEIGSGFIVSRNAGSAYVLTAQHVVDKAARILVYFAVTPDAAPSPAQVVAADRKLDLVALLVGSVPATAQALPLQLAREPGLGEPLLMVGYSLGKRTPAVRQAALAQHEGAEFFLQTAVDEMDSGSPLIYGNGVAGWVKEKDGGYARCAAASVLATALRGWQVPFAEAPNPAAPAAAQPVSLPSSSPSSSAAGCIATVVSATGGSKQVFQGATRSSPIAGTLPEGTRVAVVGQRFSDAKLWYRISAGDRRISGYLPDSDLALIGNCNN